MELYLDSVDFKEIEQAFELGFLTGLTTTPTFMHRHGITDIDAAIVKLSRMVPELQVEALGETHDEIVAEAERLLTLDLAKEPVFKIPVSLVGLRACNTLVKKGHRVNVHLVYTLQQAYMAMSAGASFVCPLAGRLQDQGHDAIALFEDCVETVEKYDFNSKIMFSSVRFPDHIRQALMSGAHVCTVPWGVMKKLTENSLTSVGTDQFFEHTRMMTIKVKEVIREKNPICKTEDTVTQAMIKMTESGLGAVTILDGGNTVSGVFTDGDIRRKLQEQGNGILDKKLADVGYSKEPTTVSSEALLYEAVNSFNEKQIDNIIVLEGNEPIGMLDIQDLVKMGLLG